MQLTGERLTFIQLFRDKKFNIEIPIIQRDFAQGRASSYEIRELFLDALYHYLDTDTNIDLDFIYGSLVKERNSSFRFVPLDGQQRLTTLFLLHWYLANMENRIDEFREALMIKSNSRFTYETRTSSREFCDCLMSKQLNIELLLDEDTTTVSDIIRNSSWFYQSWDNDPTIRGMLTMLDDIDIKFRESKGFYDRLIRNENPVITFLFLNLDEFKLTDDLYIKMNARGKPLTDFENFKAKFEQLIRKLQLDQTKHFSSTFSNKPVSTLEYFSHKIDTSWADLFWTYRNQTTSLFDEQLMNFLRAVATNHYSIDCPKDSGVGNVNILRDRDAYNKLRHIPFSKYEEIGCFTESYVIHLITILDKISGTNGKLARHLSDQFFYDEEVLFRKVIQGNLSLPDSLQFFGYVQYLLNYDDLSGIYDWMRVIHNLTENTTYNRPDEYINSIRSIDKLTPHSNDILGYLANEGNVLDSFLGIQITEERIKAHLILKGSSWREAIIKQEKHTYFKGQIGFVIKFAGIFNYYSTKKHCNWSSDEDDAYFKKFNYYSDCANATFAKNGLKELENSIWERALLTKGNYLLEKGHNHSFLKNEDRDVSWKRLLRDNNGTKRNIVKQLFDDENFDHNNLVVSLNTIIASSTAVDWRMFMIRNPETIQYCQQRMIRSGYNGRVILLGQSQLNHYHADLHTYSFYKQSFEGQVDNFYPFTKAWYNNVKTTDLSPLIVLDNWKYNQFKVEILIYANYTADNPVSYRLQFGDDGRNMLPGNLMVKAIKHGFTSASNNVYIRDAGTEDAVLEILNAFCTELI